METLVYEMVDERATITLEDPDVRNALTVEMAEELTDAIQDATERDARCVIVQGSGGVFCSGGDVEAMLSGVRENKPPAENIDSFARPVNEAVESVAACPLPTVAKVDGPAFGAGGALVLACDLALASERAKISFGFRQVGLSVDSATSTLLPRTVGENVAKELVYTGELVDAGRASELGIFNHVFPVAEFEQEVHRIVDQIATGPTVALQHSKRLLETGKNRTVGEAIEAELDAFTEVLETADHEEGVQAFVDQRDPAFDGE